VIVADINMPGDGLAAGSIVFASPKSNTFTATICHSASRGERYLSTKH
jgi:hypothetical protein